MHTIGGGGVGGKCALVFTGNGVCEGRGRGWGNLGNAQGGASTHGKVEVFSLVVFLLEFVPLKCCIVWMCMEVCATWSLL